MRFASITTRLKLEQVQKFYIFFLSCCLLVLFRLVDGASPYNWRGSFCTAQYFDASFTSALKSPVILTSSSGRCPDPAANSRPSTHSPVRRFSHFCALVVSLPLHTSPHQLTSRWTCDTKGANAGPLSKSKFATEFYEETGTLMTRGHQPH